MEITLSSEKITELARTMVSVQQSLVPALKDGINRVSSENQQHVEALIGTDLQNFARKSINRAVSFLIIKRKNIFPYETVL